MKSIFFLTVILMAALTQVIPDIEAAPQAIALGPRPAIKADPIMIPDEEALGQDLDHVMEAPAEDPIEIKEPEVTKPLAEAKKELAGQVVEVYEPQERSFQPEAPVQDRQDLQDMLGLTEEQKELTRDIGKSNVEIQELMPKMEIPKKDCRVKKVAHGKASFEVKWCYNGYCHIEGTCLVHEINPLCKTGTQVTPMKEETGNGKTFKKGCKLGTTMPTDAKMIPSESGSEDKNTEDKTFWELYWWVIALVVVILLIIIGFLIWFFLRQKKKAALKAQGLNAEVASVTPVQTADGPAQVVNLEPISEGGTASSGQPGQ